MLKNNTCLRLVFAFILIVAMFATSTNVFAQGEEPPDWLKPMITACSNGQDSACQAVAAYYASLGNPQGNIEQPGKDVEFEEGMDPFAVKQGEPIDCTKQIDPTLLFSSPFDWSTSTDLGDPNKDVHVVGIFDSSFGKEIYAIESSWHAYFNDSKLLGSHAQYQGTFESVLCKAQKLAEEQGIDHLYVIGSMIPAPWNVPATGGLMTRTVRFTDVPVEVKNAEWLAPINVSLKAGNVVDCPEYYCIAQFWDGKNPKILDHFMVFQGNKVTITDVREGTIWPIKVVNSTLPVDEAGMLSRFQQMMQEKMDAEHPDTINAYVVAPSNWTPPAGLLPANLPANWTVATSP